jgi:sortase B
MEDTMEPEKKKQKKIPLARLMVIMAAVAVFLYSGSQLLTYFLDNYLNAKEQKDLIDQAVVVLPSQTTPDQPELQVGSQDIADETEPSSVPTEPVETAPIYVDFETLKAQNEDIVGWIYCPDTNINYPIVQGESNQEYLRRSHTGDYNHNGSIFMDFRNLPDFSDFNNIIYGHNMGDGVMFGSLKKYAKQDFYEKHPTMWILTPDKAFRLDLIAAMVTPSDSETYELFSYMDDLHARMEYAVSKSDFDAGQIDISQIQQVVTLSTCTYEYATARYVVIGSMVEVGYPEPPETE